MSPRYIPPLCPSPTCPRSPSATWLHPQPQGLLGDGRVEISAGCNQEMGKRPQSSSALFLVLPPPAASHPGIALRCGWARPLRWRGTLCLGAWQGTGRLVPPARPPPGPGNGAGVQGLPGVAPGARGGHAKPSLPQAPLARWGDKLAAGMDVAGPRPRWTVTVSGTPRGSGIPAPWPRRHGVFVLSHVQPSRPDLPR